MENTSAKKHSRSTRTLLFMGFVWVGLAVFGLLFDPDKRLIIGAQIVAGLVSFILYFVFKGRTQKSKE